MTRLLSEHELNFMANFVSFEKKEKLAKFKSKKDFQRSLFADLLVRALLIKRIGIMNSKLQFSINDYGKPLLRNSKIEYNLSHSGEWVVCAIDQFQIGIDIEKIVPISLGIAKRFFSYKEYYQIINKDPNERNDFFFDLWTLKESYLKATGYGLSIPLSTFSFALNKNEIVFESNDVNEKFYFKQYDIADSYKFAVCAISNLFPEKVKTLSLDEFLVDFFPLLHKNKWT
ncbi:4'-phosphopantetheinyl transferase family protein [Paenibacillus sp. FSL R5-0527]|uniref:4'-phosphopantetheinyl transferase family protein n=1 Tax=Paenibacillus sp. FSL R5-0527 TaxID=2975321 RepID=UPI0030FAA0E6